MSHCAMLQKCIAMSPQSLRKVEPDSTSCNSCCNKIVATDLMIGTHVTIFNSACNLCRNFVVDGETMCKTEKLRKEQNFDWMNQLLKQIRVNLSLQATCSLRVGYDCYRKDRNCNGGAEAGVQCSLIQSKWPSKRIPDLESMVCVGLGVQFLL